jgi:hypothetical protein
MYVEQRDSMPTQNGMTADRLNVNWVQVIRLFFLLQKVWLWKSTANYTAGFVLWSVGAFLERALRPGVLCPLRLRGNGWDGKKSGHIGGSKPPLTKLHPSPYTLVPSKHVLYKGGHKNRVCMQPPPLTGCKKKQFMFCDCLYIPLVLDKDLLMLRWNSERYSIMTRSIKNWILNQFPDLSTCPIPRFFLGFLKIN